MLQTRTPALLLAAILLIPLATAAQESSLGPHNPDLRGTAQQPLIIKTIPNEEELHRDAEYRKDRATDLATSTQAEHAQESNDIVTDVIGGATVLILIVQAIAFFRQTRELGESVQEMKKATAAAERSAQLANTSADAAVKSNELNRDALTADQRPWVAIGSSSALSFHRNGGGKWYLTARLYLTNTGKTPAHNVRVIGTLLSDASDDRLESAHLTFCSQAKLRPYNSTADILFPTEQRPIKGEISIPEKFQSTLPKDFAISGLVYYEYTKDDSAHMTAYLYRVEVNYDDLIAKWLDLNMRTIEDSAFTLTRVPRGWRAD